MSDDIKQVIAIRRDLKMRRGKEIAQGAHASMAWLAERVRAAAGGPVTLSAAEEAWITARFTKVCVQVTSEEELRALDARARERGVLCRLIVDSGRTEFGGVPTATCLAVGPAPAAEVDAITGHLSLY